MVSLNYIIAGSDGDNYYIIGNWCTKEWSN